MSRKAVGIGTFLVVLSLVMAMEIPAWSADTFSHKWWRVSFDTPIPFSEPIRLGMGAVALVSPPDSGLGQGNLEITLAAVPKDLQESMGNNEKEILAFIKGTFLGTNNPAEGSAERSFMGQTNKGDVQKTSLPKPGELEIYLIALSDGDKVAVGLTRDLNTPDKEAKKVMDMIAKTFKEIQEQ